MDDQIDWHPLRPGGANFCTRQLRTISQERVEFKPTPVALALYAILPILGGHFLVGSVFALGASGGASILLVPFLIGLAITAAGIVILKRGLVSIVFDRQEGYFWIGRHSPRNVVRKERLKAYAALDDIYALQIITELVTGGSAPDFNSYEINVVLKSGERINVTDHGKERVIYDDAQFLAEFLDVPLLEQ